MRQISVICPATAKHIAKYSPQQFVLVNETAEVYKSITEPYIQRQDPSRIQWVYNILDRYEPSA